MQINTKERLRFYSKASCVIANHILGLLQDHNITHVHDVSKNYVSVSFPIDKTPCDLSMLNLKIRIASIDTIALAAASEQDPPAYYIRYLENIKRDVWEFLNRLTGQKEDFYLALDYIDVQPDCVPLEAPSRG